MLDLEASPKDSDLRRGHRRKVSDAVCNEDDVSHVRWLRVGVIVVR